MRISLEMWINECPKYSLYYRAARDQLQLRRKLGNAIEKYANYEKMYALMTI